MTMRPLRPLPLKPSGKGEQRDVDNTELGLYVAENIFYFIGTIVLTPLWGPFWILGFLFKKWENYESKT